LATAPQSFADTTRSGLLSFRPVKMKPREEFMPQISHKRVIRLSSADFVEVMVVARDGFAQHYTGLRLPLTGLLLDPRLDLAA
jgi:hypothetical protein